MSDPYSSGSSPKGDARSAAMKREVYLVKREAPDEMRRMCEASLVSEASESGPKNASRFTNDASLSSRRFPTRDILPTPAIFS